VGDKLFEILDDLNIRDTKLLLYKDINISMASSARKRIEKSVKKKIGYYNDNNMIINRVNDILGRIFMKKKMSLALSAGLILSLAGGGYAYAKTPVGYVSMDINPSIELGVNAFDKVVSVEAYNEDGKKILECTNLINYDIKNAVDTVVANAISDGYIKEDGSSAIEITTATDKDAVATKLRDSLKEAADKTLHNNDVEAEVETENVALARRDEARKLGITPGKLNLIQKIQELDPTINVEDYKSSSVKEIQKKTIELRKNNKITETSTDDSDKTSDIVTEENNNSSDSKDNNNSSGNDKKEENINSNKGNNNTDATIGKQNNSNNANEQGKKNNNSNLENNNNGNPNLQNKDKNKNN